MSKKINPIHYKKLIKVFEKDGWVLDRTEGDHMVYVKDGYIRPVVIPCYYLHPLLLTSIRQLLYEPHGPDLFGRRFDGTIYRSNIFPEESSRHQSDLRPA